MLWTQRQEGIRFLMTRDSPWIRSRRKDQYYKLAKEKGYRSRAAFKLSEIIKSYQFIRKGDRVIELGAAPGGWTQVVSETVGKEGHVMGVDIQSVESLKQPQVSFLKLDITSDLALECLAEKFPDRIDVVISDVSPNVSGAWDLDHTRQIYLARRSFEIAKARLKLGGNFLVKVFQGNELGDFLKEVRKHFLKIRIIRPRATRTSSSELYILGLGLLDASGPC